jgi:hypothetical protein
MVKKEYLTGIIIILLIIIVFAGCRIQSEDNQENEIIRYFAAKRAELDIVKTTINQNGEVLDWIPGDSQVDGKVASPPPVEEGKGIRPVEDIECALFDLELLSMTDIPEGCVPVLRRDNLPADVVNNRRLQDFLSKYGREGEKGILSKLPGQGPTRDGSSTVHEYAASIKSVNNIGTYGRINLWDPYVWKTSEFSLCQTAVRRGDNTVEAGCQDYYQLYGDYVPHFFIYYTTNDYASRGDYIGGYNRDVAGWVQYSSTYYPAMALNNFSVYNGTQTEIYIEVRLYSGNWWVALNGNWVGYYPATLFDTTGLRTMAATAYWYGESVDIGDGYNSYTDIGSGYFASEGYAKAAYMRMLQYRNTSGSLVDYRNPVSIVETPGQYTVDERFDNLGTWGSYMYFGGPGR